MAKTSKPISYDAIKKNKCLGEFLPEEGGKIDKKDE